MDQQTASDVVNAALSDDRVALLYNEVNARSPIRVIPSEDEYWGSSTDSNGTTIVIAPTAYPAESLYHELLHASMKLNGYRQYLTFLRAVDGSVPRLVAEALDNELQHHRMFPLFVAEGFDSTRFYHDGDDRTYSRIRHELKRMKPKKTLAAEYFMKYLSVMAPGGAGGDDERSKLDQFFQNSVPLDKLTKVHKAAEKVRNWSVSETLDPGPTIIEIIGALGDLEGWWIGTSQDFPTAGYFTGPSFQLYEVKL